ncbi:MAG TPA: tRNA (5-methylaminomethyl-2-thiouridine)(34)-methyltransferase MnmD [Bacteroidia bacterium]|nr:tRNA (5-methylaminomethyl-2-thiouridine)(34)-methyltransferase MnmD [Bacteroidia bacterium]
MMERHVVATADGSHSLFVPALDEHYHSRHGALQESRHVFIEMGLRPCMAGQSQIRILEIGFGTGLNALLTAVEAVGFAGRIDYWAVEAYPLTPSETALLNYPDLVGDEKAAMIWNAIHGADWGESVEIIPGFFLTKLHAKIEDFDLPTPVDLIYFDAFAPEKQPELWSAAIFGKMFRLLQSPGLLTTYCAKGDVRRTMLAAGFQVRKEKGPPGKREMLVATKQD